MALGRRHIMLAALGFALLLAGPLSGEAQRPTATPHVGFLGMDSQMQAEWLAAFRDELRRRGYVDGRSVVIDYRWAEGRFDRLPALASELVALRVNVIVTAAPPAVRAAQHATTTIPIVMTAHDPVGMGFVESLAHPGGNITGLAFQDDQLSQKRLELLRQMVPGLARVAVIWNQEGGGTSAVRAVEAAARALGLQVLVLEVREPRDFATVIAAAKSWRAQGLAQLASPFITKNRAVLLELLASNRMPATCEMRRYVVEGCLMTYSANLAGMFRRMAYYVDRILQGTQIADLPVEQPREFELVINLKTARELGLSVPQILLLQANETVQ
jgi:putative tryptophan/tyrosine transport system substrate-binding protein